MVAVVLGVLGSPLSPTGGSLSDRVAKGGVSSPLPTLLRPPLITTLLLRDIATPIASASQVSAVRASCSPHATHSTGIQRAANFVNCEARTSMPYSTALPADAPCTADIDVSGGSSRGTGVPAPLYTGRRGGVRETTPTPGGVATIGAGTRLAGETLSQPEP